MYDRVLRQTVWPSKKARCRAATFPGKVSPTNRHHQAAEYARKFVNIPRHHNSRGVERAGLSQLSRYKTASVQTPIWSADGLLLLAEHRQPWWRYELAWGGYDPKSTSRSHRGEAGSIASLVTPPKILGLRYVRGVSGQPSSKFSVRNCARLPPRPAQSEARRDEAVSRLGRGARQPGRLHPRGGLRCSVSES